MVQKFAFSDITEGDKIRVSGTLNRIKREVPANIIVILDVVTKGKKQTK